jgi:hypothetical protein
MWDEGFESVEETGPIFSWLIAIGSIVSICFLIFVKISCFTSRNLRNDECEAANENFKIKEGSIGTLCGLTCCQSMLDSFCVVNEKEFVENRYAETVKSMDVSELGYETRSLPIEVSNASIATAQFLQAECIHQLTAADRTKLSENRQIMRAYLISKLVAPRYEIDTTGRVSSQHNQKGHFRKKNLCFSRISEKFWLRVGVVQTTFFSKHSG